MTSASFLLMPAMIILDLIHLPALLAYLQVLLLNVFKSDFQFISYNLTMICMFHLCCYNYKFADKSCCNCTFPISSQLTNKIYKCFLYMSQNFLVKSVIFYCANIKILTPYYDKHCPIRSGWRQIRPQSQPLSFKFNNLQLQQILLSFYRVCPLSF